MTTRRSDKVRRLMTGARRLTDQLDISPLAPDQVRGPGSRFAAATGGVCAC